MNTVIELLEKEAERKNIKDFVSCFTGEEGKAMGNTVEEMKHLVLSGNVMFTIEPVMDFNLEFMLFMFKKIEPEQINIGADSGNNHLPEPPPEKIAALVEALRPFTRVHLKPNLERLYKEA
jgi:hypothetical protein